jgi:hypothetical protein
MSQKISYDYKVLLDGEGTEEERTTVYRNCRVDIAKRVIRIVDRDTGEDLLHSSRRAVLKITRLPAEEDRT